MATTSNAGEGGVGFLGLLTVLFVGLKLTNFLAWSWWWVLAPTWVPLLVGLLIAGWALWKAVG